MLRIRRHRKAATQVIYRKTVVSIIKRGKVVHSIPYSTPNYTDCLDAFLRGYAPDLAAHLRNHNR